MCVKNPARIKRIHGGGGPAGSGVSSLVTVM
jgi:hypothetical protein